MKNKLFTIAIATASMFYGTLEPIGCGDGGTASYRVKISRLMWFASSPHPTWTGMETGNTQAVLDGDLDNFIEVSLKSGL